MISNPRRSLLAFLAGATLFPALAFGHATPISYAPENGALIGEAPKEVSVVFSERLERGASSITVFYPDGTRSSGGEFGDDPRAMGLPLIGATDGNYAVTWQVVSSDDGHFTKGAFSFAVGTGTAMATSAPADFSIVHRTSALDTVAVSLELFGEGILLALFAFLVFVAHPLRRRSLAEFFPTEGDRAVSWLGISAGALLIAGSAAFLYENAAAFQAFRGTGAFGEALSIFSQTSAGFYAWMQIAAGLVGGMAVFLGGWRLWGGNIFGVHGVLALLSLAAAVFARSRVSHAAASHILPDASIGMNVLHLIGKHGWIDFLLVFIILSPFLLKELGGTDAAFCRIRRRADLLLSGAFALAGVTGLYIVWLHLKDFANLGATLWGKRALALFLAMAALAALRIWNHWRLSRAPENAANARLALGMEFGAGMVVTVMTAAIILTSPPIDAFPEIQKVASRDMVVSLAPSRTEEGMMLVTLEDARGEAIPIEKAIVVASNPFAGVSDVIPAAERRFVNGIVFPLRALAPTGEWSLAISLSREGGYDAVGRFSLEVPPEGPREWPQGGYTAAFVVLSFFALVLAGSMARRTLAFREPPDGGGVAGGAALLPPLLAMTATFLVLGGAIFAAERTILRSPMEQDCRAEGLLWHASVPMRDWVPTSPVARDGCSFHIRDGMYHIADPREYEFLKAAHPAGSFVSMDHAGHSAH